MHDFFLCKGLSKPPGLRVQKGENIYSGWVGGGTVLVFWVLFYLRHCLSMYCVAQASLQLKIL